MPLLIFSMGLFINYITTRLYYPYTHLWTMVKSAVTHGQTGGDGTLGFLLHFRNKYASDKRYIFI